MCAVAFTPRKDDGRITQRVYGQPPTRLVHSALNDVSAIGHTRKQDIRPYNTIQTREGMHMVPESASQAVLNRMQLNLRAICQKRSGA